MPRSRKTNHDNEVVVNGRRYPRARRPAANRFHAALDEYCGRLAQGGAVVAVTADHGMNDKAREDGTPRAVHPLCAAG